MIKDFETFINENFDNLKIHDSLYIIDMVNGKWRIMTYDVRNIQKNNDTTNIGVYGGFITRNFKSVYDDRIMLINELDVEDENRFMAASNDYDLLYAFYKSNQFKKFERSYKNYLFEVDIELYQDLINDFLKNN